MPINIEIRTAGERDAADRLIERLLDAPEDTPEECKLKMLIAACEAWDVKRDREFLAQDNPFCVLMEVQEPTVAAVVGH